MYNFYTKTTGVPLRYIQKFLLIMRLTTAFLIVGIIQVSAASYAQKISLNETNAPIERIFNQIRLQSGYDFLFNRDLIKKAIPVDINVHNATIRQALEECFAGQPFTYVLEANTIVVKQKEHSFLDNLAAAFTNIDVRGIIVDSLGRPLANASVKIKGKDIYTTTDQNGEFYMSHVEENAWLEISYIGYTKQQVRAAKFVSIVLKAVASKLDEVVIGNNGYQDIPKERATGSFEVITAKQLQHSSSGNLLQRLDGITTSIVFNNTTSPNNSAANVRSANPSTGFGLSPQTYNGGFTLDNMTIRGKNTLSTNGSGEPLVVIDGIANPYDISLINPDDVVSITILKDAAAASIWGSRAANGVLVIKTKKGEFNRPPVVTFNGNVTIYEKPDLYYLKQMNSSDFIDAEIYGFQQAHTNLATPDIHNGYTGKPVSPVDEILDSINKGTLPSADGYTKIDALRKNDIRKDQTKYLLKNAVSQNYSLNVSGGSKNTAYILSGGYQRSLNNTVKSNSDRINGSLNMQFKPVKHLDLSSGISYDISNTNGLGPLSLSPPFAGLSNLSPYFYPYTRLADDAGNPLAVPFYRPGFISALNSAYGNHILDYTYKPLEDINDSYLRTNIKNLNINLNARYTFSPAISAQLSYNYSTGSTNTNEFYNGQSIYMRDLINRFTDPVTFTRNIPLGGFYNPGHAATHNQTARGLLSFNKNWNSLHELTAIIGAEIFASKSTTDPTYGYYGYDPGTLKAGNVTYNTYFNTLFDPNYSTSSPLPNPPGISFLGNRSRTLSEFFNAAYTYDRRYTLSGSVRKDGSSAFADQTNKTGTPFYSIGASWEINNEKFYNIKWLPYLKLRATFGYNGNANPGSTPYARITIPNYVDYRTSLPYATVNNLSDSKLRPERTAITNIALDYGTKNNRISGSLEYYRKITKDLLSFSPLDPTLGTNGQTYNVADLRGSGIDFRFRSLNIKVASFTWETNLNFSYNDVKVTKNYVSKDVAASTVVTNTNYYFEGRRLSTVYAYHWGGLDSANGAARALTAKGPDETGYTIPNTDLKNIGSAVPLYYGNLGNTFSFKGFSLWANIIYKLGYFQRRPASSLFLNSIQMSSYSPQQVAGQEYTSRWQKPGDEKITNVPSRDINRSQFNDYLYQYADINVYKADNIRLQEVNLNYTFRKGNSYIKNPRIYITVPVNLIIWRANKLGLDPDIYDYPVPRAYGFGFSANF